MDLNLKSHRAVVTGSTGGIGYAAARELAAMGATVAINGRTQARVDAAIAKLKGEVAGGSFIAAPGDLGSVKGAADIIRADYTPKMVKRGWGRVVFISSESGLHIPTEMVHYGMTKTAQIAVARGLAETVSGTGVTVNSVLPGPTLSEGVGDFMSKMSGGATSPDLEKMGRDFIRDHRSTSLLGRMATTEEVASMIAYVCSLAASATSGAALRVDGGVVRAIP